MQLLLMMMILLLLVLLLVLLQFVLMRFELLTLPFGVLLLSSLFLHGDLETSSPEAGHIVRTVGEAIGFHHVVFICHPRRCLHQDFASELSLLRFTSSSREPTNGYRVLYRTAWARQ
jgi:hypothetical protein